MTTSEEREPAAIALLGKIGHGKTFLVNKLCGESFSSNMMSMSCTREINLGATLKYGIEILDTPGFFSSDDSASHLLAQKQALESRNLSGIYLIVKIGRPDEMVETLNRLMDFAGDDAIRVIVTHVDTIHAEEGFDPIDSKQRMSQMLDIEQKYISFVGKETNASDIEDFIQESLSEPRKFHITNVQMASVAPQSVGSTRFTGDLNNIADFVDTVERFCFNQIVDTSKSAVKCDTMLLRMIRTEMAIKVDQLSECIRSRLAQELTRLEDEKIVQCKLDEEIAGMVKKVHDRIEDWITGQPRELLTKSDGFHHYPMKKKARKCHRTKNHGPLNAAFRTKICFEKNGPEKEWIIFLLLDGLRVTVDQVRNHRRTARRKELLKKEKVTAPKSISNNPSFLPAGTGSQIKMIEEDPESQSDSRNVSDELPPSLNETTDPESQSDSRNISNGLSPSNNERPTLLELEGLQHILDDDMEGQFIPFSKYCPLNSCSIL